jgi:peroxiredoxin Q/BCP
MPSLKPLSLLVAAGLVAAAITACNHTQTKAYAISRADGSKEQAAMSDTGTTPERHGSMNIQVGDKAPDFSLPMYPSGTFKLSDHLGKEVVVLYFYPQDDTPGCTKEACTFRDTHDDFVQAGAVIYGVSQDPLESHKDFAEKFHLPFPLLVDEGNRVREMFGMPDPLAPLHARVTYVIDKEGVVRHIIGAAPERVEVDEHITQALAWAKQLAAEGRDEHKQ